jgi:hypothetical protein
MSRSGAINEVRASRDAQAVAVVLAKARTRHERSERDARDDGGRARVCNAGEITQTLKQVLGVFRAGVAVDPASPCREPEERGDRYGD